MAVVNPALELARQRQRGQQKSNVVTFRQAMAPRGTGDAGPVLSGGSGSESSLQALARQMFHDSERRDAALKVAEGEDAPQSGWRGLVGDVLGNDFVQAALKPLEILDVPRRAVISGIHEISDAVGSGDASWSDFKEQVADPTYGVGRYIDTGNIWVDRLLGFGGDVLLDPLTYVTLGGSKASKAIGATGKEGRVVLAERLVEKGYSVERAMEVARGGKAMMTADELQKLGLDRSGVYFMGRRVAGTGRVGAALDKGIARTRIRLGDTIFNRKVEDLFSPQDAAAARKALAHGVAPKERAAEYLHLVTSRNAQRAAEEAAMREGSEAAKTLMTSIDNADFEGARKTAHRALEKTEGIVITDGEARVADKVGTFFRDLWRSVDNDYKQIDPDGGFSTVHDYFPHMRTEAAFRYMETDNPFVEGLRSVIDDPTETVGVFKHRMREGDTFFGVELGVDDLNVDSLNRIAREQGFAGDFFETDLQVVLDKYVSQWAQQKGIVARSKYLHDKGVFQSIVEREVVDEKAVRAAQTAVAKASKQQAAHMGRASKAVERLGQSMERLLLPAQKIADDELGALEIGLRSGEQRVAAAAYERSQAVKELGDAAHALSEAQATYKTILGQDEPEILGAMYARFDETKARVERLRAGLDESTMVDADARAELDGLRNDLADLTAQQQLVTEYGNVIQSQLDDIIAGKVKGDVAKSVRQGFKSRSGVQGGFKDAVRGREGLSTAPWWKRITKHSSVDAKGVADMGQARLDEIVSSAVRGDGSLTEMRQAQMHMLARDVATYGSVENLPAHLRPIADRLLGPNGTMERADVADRYLRILTKDKGRMTRWRNLERIHDGATTVIREARDAADMYVSARKLLVRFDNVPFSGEVPLDFLDRMLVGEYDSLRPLFADFLPNEEDEIRALMGATEVLDPSDVVEGFSIQHGTAAVAAESQPAAAATLSFEQMQQMLQGAVESVRQRSWETVPKSGGPFGTGATGKTERLWFTDIVGDQLDDVIDVVADKRRATIDSIIETKLGWYADKAKAARKEMEALVVPGVWDPRGTMLTGAAHEARGQLAKDMTEYWLLSEVNARFAAMSRSLAPFGLAPTEDMLRKVVNQVAREKSLSVVAETRSAREVLSALSSARAAVAKATSPEDARRIISSMQGELFDRVPGAERVLARMGAETQAPELYRRFIELGGRTNATKAAKASKGVDAAAHKLARREWFDNVAVPWFQAVTGSHTKPTFAELGDVLKSTARGRSWADPEATVADMATWLESSIGKLEEGLPRLRRESSWLERAADPFVDAEKLMVSPSTRQNVPSLYAYLLEDRASTLEGLQTALSASESRVAASGGELGQLRVEALTAAPRKLGEAFPDEADALVRARKAHKRLVAMQNDPDYLAAVEREHLNRVLGTLADYDGHGDRGIRQWATTEQRASEVLRQKGKVVERLDDGSFVPIVSEADIKTGGVYFAEENGVRVPLTPGARPILVDGKRLQFTRAEWRALYAGGTNDAEALARELRAVEAEITFVQRESIRRAEQQATMGVPSRPLAEEARLRELSRHAESLRDYIAAADPAVQASALQKMHDLSQGIKNGHISLDSVTAALDKGSALADPTIAATRKAALEKLWNGSRDDRVLRKVGELRDSVEEELFTTRLRDAERMATEARRARQQYDGIAAQISQTQSDALDSARQASAAGGDQIAALFGDLGTPQGMREGAAALRAAEPPLGPLTTDTGAAERGALMDSLQGAESMAAKRVADTSFVRWADTMAVEAAEQQAAQIEKAIDAVRQPWAQRKAWKLEAKQRTIDERLTPELNRAERAAAVAANEYDMAKLDQLGFEQWAAFQTPYLDEKRRAIASALETAKVKPDSMTAVEMKAYIEQVDKTLADVQALGVGTDAATQAVVRKSADALAATEALFTANRTANEALANLAWETAFPKMAPSIGPKTLDGFMSLERLGLPSLQTSQELGDMLKNMSKFQRPAIAKELGRFLGGYTKFFKAYATLSPGFHVRNALSNTFMLVAAGAEPTGFRRSLRLYSGWADAVKRGAEETFVKSLPDEERGLFTAALKAVDAVGGGRHAEAFMGWNPKRNALANNPVTRLSQRYGQKVEGSARFMLAYDTVRQGAKRGLSGDELINTASARVRRFLFDYTDVGHADDSIRTIIPFWMWMSRNLPLQITNQWANPKAYAIFGNLMRNIGQDDSGDVVPSWLTDMGAAKVTDDWYFAPDIGSTRVKTQLEEFLDPMRLGSYVNPGLRLPVEIMGQRQLYNDVPFSDKPQPVTGGPLSGPLGALMDALGMAERNADGERVADPKWNYLVQNLLPTVGQAERLMPNTEGGKERQLGSWLSYFGAPVRQVTPAMRESEAKRRTYEMEDMAKAAKALGFQP